MIPKILHYCWISEYITENISKYIQSWKHFMPDYQIIKWDLSNFDISKSDWVREVVEKKKWAFAADYFSPKNGDTKEILITNSTYCIHHFTDSWITPFMIFKTKIARIIGRKNFNKIKKILKLGNYEGL
jgi:hypothetical protein